MFMVIDVKSLLPISAILPIPGGRYCFAYTLFLTMCCITRWWQYWERVRAIYRHNRPIECRNLLNLYVTKREYKLYYTDCGWGSSAQRINRKRAVIGQWTLRVRIFENIRPYELDLNLELSNNLLRYCSICYFSNEGHQYKWWTLNSFSLINLW